MLLPPLYILTLLTQGHLSDPSDPTTNLDFFVRTIGSKDSTVSSINYLNGTVYAKQPRNGLQRLFNFEGFNINRKLSQDNGSYLCLSRELVIYRNPNTSQILQVWLNPWTSKANEVFMVANDPVNGFLKLGNIFPYQTILGQQIVFNTDYVLEYPNPLSPAKYSKYSAGPDYNAAELFGYFSNLSALENPQTSSVPMVGTWIRKAQYLPWMEMSNSSGSLFYTTLNWKCDDLVSCLADDILELVNDKYAKYKNAPTENVDPNETSWIAFKKIIDQRRADGQPDIIIPQVPIVTNLTTKENFIDSRVLALLSRPIQRHVMYNGSAWSEIAGKQSQKLIDFAGYVQFDFYPLSTNDGFKIQLNGYIKYVDTDGRQITTWKNPVTGKSIGLQNPAVAGIDFEVENDFIYTIDMKPVGMVGLILACSTDVKTQNSSAWSTNFANIIFQNTELSPMFYGTAARFSSWPEWMKMGDVQGNMVAKVTFYHGS